MPTPMPKVETPQVQAKNGLINVLKFAAEGVIEPDEQTTGMIKRCVFDVLNAYYGSELEKYRANAVNTVRRIMAEVPGCPVKFTDVELRRMVSQAVVYHWQHNHEREKVLSRGGDVYEFERKCYQEHEREKFFDKLTGMIAPSDDSDSPSSRLGELTDYIRTWADFPAFGFGIPKLDSTIGGIFPGEVCVLTGAPGTMKTSLALCAVDDFVTRAKKGLVYYCTVDMDAKELTMRLIERETGVSEPLVRVKANSRYPRDREEYTQMWQAITSKYDGRLIIRGNEPGKPRMTWDTLRIDCLMRQPQLVVIDYFTCLKAPLQSDLEFVELAMPSVVDFAHEFETCFLILSQMSRASRSEQATGRMGGHGKGGGIVEERAHTEIELTHQPNPDSNKSPLVIAGISKARHGQSGVYFSLDYDGPIKKFTGTAQRVVKSKSATRTVFELDQNDPDRGFYDGITAN